jgi:hypothetical protein
MAFEGRLRLPLAAEDLRRHFPPMDTWLRVNPQWSVLTLKPAGRPGDFDLQLRLDEDDREQKYAAQFRATDDKRGWRLDLNQDGDVRAIDIEIAADGRVGELVLRDTSIADNDGPARMNLALWLRAPADYALLSASPRWRARLGKWLLDRIWLRMNLTGRRVAILILAYEVVGLAFLIAWLIWERVAG